MRSLIRAYLKPSSKFTTLWANRAKYDREIIKLFLDIGYTPQLPKLYDLTEEGLSDEHLRIRQGHNDLVMQANELLQGEGDPTESVLDFFARNSQRLLINSMEVSSIFEDVPPGIKEEETKHLIMLGYASKGQSNFLVCEINQTELHIRTRQGLFNRLRLCSTEICEKIRRHRRRSRKHHPMKKLGFFKKDLTDAHLKIDKTIEVMEAHRDHPTISGQIIDNPFIELYRNDKPELVLATLTFIIAVVGFFKTPSIAPPIQQFLANRGYTYQVQYIQGALERIYSAFLVTFFVTFISLLLKLFGLWRDKPIVWNSGIKAERGQAK